MSDVLPCDFDLELAALVNRAHARGIDNTRALLADAEAAAHLRQVYSAIPKPITPEAA